MSRIPEGDVWRLYDTDSDSLRYGKSVVFNFCSIEVVELKKVVKEYIWRNYRSGARNLVGLREMLRSMTWFSKFCESRGVHTLKELDNGIVDDYRAYLRTEISPIKGRPLSYVTQACHFSALKSLVGWCQAFIPDMVPVHQVFTGGEYSRVRNNSLKVQFIPEIVLEQIDEAIEREDNPYLKNGLKILECTGMRIGDLLSLKTNCISKHPISGWTISWFNHKSKKDMQNIPVPEKCRHAVKELIDITYGIRIEADDLNRDKLFIYKPLQGRSDKGVVTISVQVFQKWCRGFSKKHGILDSDGDYFRLTTHMFRRTLATDMISKGTSLNAIKEVMGHSDTSITKKYYAEIKDTYYSELFENIGILGNVNEVDDNVIPAANDLSWFQENHKGKARLCDGYCTMPIKDGEPCGRFLSRQKCYMCSRYITTLEDLEAHKEHLADLEELMDNNIYGDHFASHIAPTILILREIIRRLEELKDG